MSMVKRALEDRISRLAEASGYDDGKFKKKPLDFCVTICIIELW